MAGLRRARRPSTLPGVPTRPETKYAKTSDGLHIAYQAIGSSANDLLWTGGFFTNVELMWRIAPMARFTQALASFARLLQFDPRGTGASDRFLEEGIPTLETRMADAVSVMDAVGSPRAAVFGFDATGPVALLTAATFPERTTALILMGTEPCGLRHDDYPFAWSYEQWDDNLREIETRWGEESYLFEFHDWLAPSAAGDPELKRDMISYFRLSASPAAAIAATKMERDTDVRPLLSAIHVPTLILHRVGDAVYPIEGARFIAEHIPDCRLVELPGDDHLPWFGDTDRVVTEVASFLSAVRDEEAELDRVLATVLFTDIVGSTERAAALGDRAWSELLARHHQVVRALLARHRGVEVDTAGDGFLATFDGPARAIRCAQRIVEAVRTLGLEIRAGLHTGEIETDGTDVRGIAVHVGARVASLADPTEILVSQTVKDLVAGATFRFEDRGEHELKGVPDRWHLYRVVPT